VWSAPAGSKYLIKNIILSNTHTAAVGVNIHILPIGTPPYPAGPHEVVSVSTAADTVTVLELNTLVLGGEEITLSQGVVDGTIVTINAVKIE
jgi:hypothetical protein